MAFLKDEDVEVEEKDEQLPEKKTYKGLQDFPEERRKEVARMGAEKANGYRMMMRDAQRLLKSRPHMEVSEVMDNLLGAGHNCTMSEAILITQANKAVTRGDTRAAEFVRDTAGEKPSEKIDINQEVSIQRFERKIIEIVDNEVIDTDFEEVKDDDWEL